MKRSSTETLIGAMNVLADEIESPDLIANMAIAEAACRLGEQAELINDLVREIGVENLSEKLKKQIEIVK